MSYKFGKKKYEYKANLIIQARYLIPSKRVYDHYYLFHRYFLLEFNALLIIKENWKRASEENWKRASDGFKLN